MEQTFQRLKKQKQNLSQERSCDKLKILIKESGTTLNTIFNNMEKKELTKQMDFIVGLVCDITHLSRQELFSKARQRHLVDARRLAFALMRELFGLPYQTISKHFAMNHASIIHSIKLHKNLLEFDAVYRGRYTKIFRLMYQKYNEEVIDFLKDKLNDDKGHIINTLREDNKII